jgi:poly(3-hydroxybutyrate) depolymerase
MQYYVSLPAGWTPVRRWPIVVTNDGADHTFRLQCQTFMRARGAQPFIIVTPVTVSNGGRRDPRAYPYAPDVWAAAIADPLAFDEAGVLAVIRDVQQDEHGADMVALTGFSAGGHLAWQRTLTHPARWGGVAFAAANYAGRGLTALSNAPERADLPIHAFQGDRDSLRGRWSSNGRARGRWPWPMGT